MKKRITNLKICGVLYIDLVKINVYIKESREVVISGIINRKKLW